MIAYLHEVLRNKAEGKKRNNAERSCITYYIPFTHFLPLVTSCGTTAQYGNQDTDIYVVKI